MLWSENKQYFIDPFEQEKDLEASILKVQDMLFGDDRIYLEVKKKIGKKGGVQNIPDAYLIDLSSKKVPALYVVENELSSHDPLKHVAVQILKFSLSFETTPQKVKNVLKNALQDDEESMARCNTYAQENDLDNVDYLLERMIYGANKFNALVIIDEMHDELETVLVSRFRFPVEVITLQRLRSSSGDYLYQFEPFLYDISEASVVGEDAKPGRLPPLDPFEIDTIVVPARDEGFQETFMAEECWYKIRINSSMIPRIKYIAVYRVAPNSAITHIAPVRAVEQYKDTNKYVLYFSEPASKIGPLKLDIKGRVKAPQAPRYTSYQRLAEAKTLDDAF